MAMLIDELLLLALERRASDIHLKAGRPPLFRVASRIVPTEQEPLTPADAETLAYSMMVGPQIQTFETSGELDFSYGIPGKARFRVNVFRARGQVGAVLRAIPLRVPSIEELGMPAVLKDMVSKPQGLVLITGPTGSGKSTTLAALIDFLNANTQGHIVTIEDPIEYVHPDQRCSVTQREVGLDTRSFAEALRRALRQDPDIVLIGEMRDLETIES
ncbi:MAG: Flp pilus assembly complex ATPase component TadA, partial [Armatimonadetes bacterium]|nr:Flp pilus assembly complex ATPase component TadA [Armatimonadota bacterium]